jgi:hypothetical protein
MGPAITGTLDMAHLSRSIYDPGHAPPLPAAPWTVTRTQGGWRVDATAARPLACVYGRDGRRRSKHLTTEEARRIATKEPG